MLWKKIKQGTGEVECRGVRVDEIIYKVLREGSRRKQH